MYRDRAIPFFLKLGIPKLDDLVLFEKAIFVFKLVIKSLSLHLDNCSIWYIYKLQYNCKFSEKYMH